MLRRGPSRGRAHPAEAAQALLGRCAPAQVPPRVGGARPQDRPGSSARSPQRRPLQRPGASGPESVRPRPPCRARVRGVHPASLQKGAWGHRRRGGNHEPPGHSTGDARPPDRRAPLGGQPRGRPQPAFPRPPPAASGPAPRARPESRTTFRAPGAHGGPRRHPPPPLPCRPALSTAALSSASTSSAHRTRAAQAPRAPTPIVPRAGRRPRAPRRASAAPPSGLYARPPAARRSRRRPPNAQIGRGSPAGARAGAGPAGGGAGWGRGRGTRLADSGPPAARAVSCLLGSGRPAVAPPPHEAPRVPALRGARKEVFDRRGRGPGGKERLSRGRPPAGVVSRGRSPRVTRLSGAGLHLVRAQTRAGDGRGRAPRSLVARPAPRAGLPGRTCLTPDRTRPRGPLGEKPGVLGEVSSGKCGGDCGGEGTLFPPPGPVV